MIEVNLLPWRTERRAKIKRNNQLSIVIGVIVGCVILWVIHEGFNNYLGQLNKRCILLEKTLNQMQESVNKAIEQKKRYEILNRQYSRSQRLDYKLQAARKEFRELDAVVTQQVKVTDIRVSKNILTLKGETNSIEKLQSLVVQLQKVNYFSHFQMKDMNRLPGASYFTFTLIADSKEDDHASY